MIASACSHKIRPLFDTFAGLPEDDQATDGYHKGGEFAADDQDVRRLLASCGERIRFHIGRFPATAPDEVRYSFVHFDGDTYQAAKDALAYFWPRLSVGASWSWMIGKGSIAPASKERSGNVALAGCFKC